MPALDAFALDGCSLAYLRCGIDTLHHLQRREFLEDLIEHLQASAQGYGRRWIRDVCTVPRRDLCMNERKEVI